MKFGVVTFPGSNCDQDMLHALRHDLGQEAVSLWHKDHDLQGVDMVFSLEDFPMATTFVPVPLLAFRPSWQR